MARAATGPLDEGGAPAARAARAVRSLTRVAGREPTMTFGLSLLFILVAISLIGPFAISNAPTKINMDARLDAPSAAYWFGTDAFGRDVFSRTISGGRISLLVAASVAVLTMLFGAAFGSLAGYFRKVDAVLMRVMDGLMAIPTVLLAIALMVILGASLQNVIIAIVIVDTPRMTRVARASVLSLREQPFVDAARAIGAQNSRILLRHVVPNLLAPLIVMGTYVAASAMLTEAYLSFLGAGIPAIDNPSWGNIMAEGRGFIHKAMWVIFFPGLVLAVTVTSINLAGDGLRDILDPKLAHRL